MMISVAGCMPSGVLRYDADRAFISIGSARGKQSASMANPNKTSNLESSKKLETKTLLAAAVAACEEKKGEDLRILELDPAESGLTDYFLVVSGTNPRQIQAIADEVEFTLKRDFGQYANSREGYKQAEWILLDYVDFVVHVFSQEKRAFYDIERLRKSAHTMTPDDLRRALVEKTASVRNSAVSTKADSTNPVGTTAVSKKPAGKKSAVKAAVKTVGTKKSAARKGVSKKSAGKTAGKTSGTAAGKRAGAGSVPMGRPSWAPKATGKSAAGSGSKSRKKSTPKSTPKSKPKSRKRS
jgi:ribosome-associated protein